MNGNAMPYNWNPSSSRDMSRLLIEQRMMSNQNQWGMASSVIGNALGIKSDLPFGYTREQYEEERAMMANHYVSSASTAFGAAVGIGLGNAAIWGSPTTLAAKSIYGSAWTAHGFKRTGLSGFSASTFDASAGWGVRASAPLNMYSHPTTASSFMGRAVLGFERLSEMSSTFGSMIGEGIGRGAGTIVGQSARGALNLTGYAAERGLNYVTGGAAESLFSPISNYGSRLAADEGVGVLSSIRRGAGGLMSSPLRYTTSTLARGTASVFGKVGSAIGGFLNPMVLAQMYAMDKVMGYGFNMSEISNISNELDKSMLEKSDRILRYGSSDDSRGLSGGFSSAQRARFSEMVKTMAASDVSSSDLLGLGKNSILGGQTAYKNKLGELKAIFNAGTDMGMFDSARTFEQFEKKFAETVKVVEKMSNLIKKSKGEVMALMAGMRNEGFANSPTEMGQVIARKDAVAKITGVDLGTVNMETQAVSEMFRSRGISPKTGSKFALDSRMTIDRSVRSGFFTEEDVLRLGGRQNMIVEMANSELNMMNDQNFVTELARMIDIDPSTGKASVNRKRYKRTLDSANNRTLALEEADARRNIRSIRSYSQLHGKEMEGGWLADRLPLVQEMMAKGDISQEMITDLTAAMEQSRHITLSPNGTQLSKEEALTNAYQRAGMSRDLAQARAKEHTGVFRTMRANESLQIERQRNKEQAEADRLSYGGAWGYASRFAGSAWALTKHLAAAPVDLLGNQSESETWRSWLGVDSNFSVTASRASRGFYSYTVGDTGKEKDAARAYDRWMGERSTRELLSGKSSEDIRDSLMTPINIPVDNATKNIQDNYKPILDKQDRGRYLSQRTTDETTMLRAAMHKSMLLSVGKLDGKTGKERKTDLTAFFGTPGVEISSSQKQTLNKLKELYSGKTLDITKDNAEELSYFENLAFVEALESFSGNEDAQRKIMDAYSQAQERKNYVDSSGIRRTSSEVNRAINGLGTFNSDYVDKRKVGRSEHLKDISIEDTTLLYTIASDKTIQRSLARGQGAVIDGKKYSNIELADKLNSLSLNSASASNFIDPLTAAVMDKEKMKEMYLGNTERFGGANRMQELRDIYRGRLLEGAAETKSAAIAAYSSRVDRLLNSEADVGSKDAAKSLQEIIKSNSFSEASSKTQALLDIIRKANTDKVADNDIQSISGLGLTDALINSVSNKKLTVDNLKGLGIFTPEDLKSMQASATKDGELSTAQAAEWLTKKKYIFGEASLALAEKDPETVGNEPTKLDAEKLKSQGLTKDNIDNVLKAAQILERVLIKLGFM